MRTPNWNLRDLAQLHELHNRSAGKSERTVGWYQEVLKLFCTWLEEQGIPQTLEPIDVTVAQRFILHLQGLIPARLKLVDSQKPALDEDLSNPFLERHSGLSDHAGLVRDDTGPRVGAVAMAPS